MTWTIALLLAIGFAALWLGAEWLVKGAVSLSVHFGVSSLVIGLTVVAFATSAPELAVCLLAAFDKTPDIATGNVVGSNLCNILFILGLSAVVKPGNVTQGVLRRELPLLSLITMATYVFVLDREISRVDGIILVAGIVAFTAGSYIVSRREVRASEVELPTKTTGIGAALALVIGGLVALVLGADWFLGGAVQLAQNFGISERIIGLTLVAAGTSLPEVATSVSASIRREGDIVLGNIIGSNIFNLLAILGLTASVYPINVVDAIVRIDYPFMLLVTLGLWPVAAIGRRISRIEGVIFLAIYASYILFLSRN